MTRALVVTCFVAKSDAGRASPAVAVEIVRINSRRDIPKLSADALCLSDWAAREAAWPSNLASGVCAIVDWSSSLRFYCFPRRTAIRLCVRFLATKDNMTFGGDLMLVGRCWLHRIISPAS